MTVIRDSGYKQAPNGNVAVDFVWGNMAPQTGDDRVTSPSYNATGGTSGSTSYLELSATVTAASASGGTVTYTANNEFVAGQIVTITGLSTSAFNLSSVVIASASSTQFTVTNAATGTAVTGASATAVVPASIIPGIGADTNWSTTTDIASAKLSDNNYTIDVGAFNASAPSDSHDQWMNNWNAYPANSQPTKATGGFNQAYTLTAVVTAVSGNGTTVTYTANNAFSSGQTVTISGLYNYVSAGSTQPIATQYYAKTYTTASAFNLSAVTIASATPTSFTVTNAASDSALTGVNGVAVVTVAASNSTAAVPTVTGVTVQEAIRLLGVAGFNVGTVTIRNTGATAANNETVYSQSLTGTQTLGSTVNLVYYQTATNESEAASATNATEFTVEE